MTLRGLSSRRRDSASRSKSSSTKQHVPYLTAEQQEDLLLSGDATAGEVRQKLAVLRVEQVGNKEGKVLEIIFWFFMVMFVVYGIVTIVLSATNTTRGETNGVSSTYYIGNLAALSTLLGVLTYMICFFVYRFWKVWRHKSIYKMRQKFMLMDVRVIAGLCLIDLSTVVASYSLFVAAECVPNRGVITILSMIRSFVFLAVLGWMTVTARLMRVYKVDSRKPWMSCLTSILCCCRSCSNTSGKGTPASGGNASDSGEEEGENTPPNDEREEENNDKQDPDRILLIDQPVGTILKDQILFLTIYAVFMVIIIIAIVLKLGSYKTNPGPSDYPPYDPSTCPSGFSVDCSASTATVIEYAITAVCIVFYTIFYFVAVRTSWRTQMNLPSSHFRLSKLFLRIQMRYGRLLFFAIFFTGVIGELSTIGTCQGSVTNALGSPSTHLALGIYAITLLLLYSPARVDDSYNRAIFKSIAWTEEDIPGKRKERIDMIDTMTQHQGILDKLSTNPAKFLAKQIGVPDALGLFEKPMESVFCMEYVCKMFLWTRAAYRSIEKGVPEYVPEERKESYPYSKSAILNIFNMDEFEHFYEEKTDTYAIMGWGNKTLVLSFRGTASNANILTDLKAWSIRYPPHPYLTSGDTFGGVDIADAAKLKNVGSKLFKLPVRVHKGFYEAWSSDDFNKKVVDVAVRAVEQMGNGSDIKIFITGHSLGGALACLASVELKIALPSQNVTVYTFGAPRVGNIAFGTFANILIPDYWHIVGTEDPVARIPKGSYKRSGHRVLLGSNGNMEIYPSHFEASLFSSVGGKVSDHLLKNYGARLGQFIKAQFMPSISIAGAAEGVDRLSKKIDLEKTTLVGPLNGENLYDQNLQIQSIEFAEAPKIKSRADSKNASQKTCECLGCFRKSSDDKELDLEEGNAYEHSQDADEVDEDGYVNLPNSLDDQVVKFLQNVL